jgi:hypothetical protein
VTLQFDTFYPWLDLAGLTVFAASGALLAARKRLDLIGACFFALVTAVGGRYLAGPAHRRSDLLDADADHPRSFA